MTEGHERYSEIVRKISSDIGVDDALLSAIVQVESNWNRYACRYEPLFVYQTRVEKFAKLNGISEATENIMQKCSWGLGQIMGATSRAIGFDGPLPALCEPLEGLRWAAIYLKHKRSQYDSLANVISAYNAGESRLTSDGRQHLNQAYVDKVLIAMKLAR